MKAILIAKKTLLELFREPMLLGLFLTFPLLLLGVYYLAMGGGGSSLSSVMTVMVANLDEGDPRMSSNITVGEHLVEWMRGVEFEGKPAMQVNLVSDPQDALASLRDRKATLMLVIPKNFSTQIYDRAAGSSNQPVNFEMVGDPGSDMYVFTRSFIEGGLHEWVLTTSNQPVPPPIQYTFTPGTGTMSDFDFGVPGVIVFGIMFVVVSTAQVMIREEINHTLRRLKLSRVSAKDLLAGVSLAQIVIAAVQFPITYLCAVFFGFQSQGSLLLALGICLLLSLSAIGLGLIVACFVHSDSEAANLGSVVGVMMVLLSGVLYPMPDAPLFTLANRVIQAYDLLPTTHAANAMRKIFTQAAGLADIGFEMVMLFLLSSLILILAILIYQRRQLRSH